MKYLVFFLLGLCMSIAPIGSDEQKLIVIRHGEADNNVSKFYSSNPDNPNYKPSNLTEAGRKAIQATAQSLLSQGINDSNIVAVYVSPLPRTMQTADLLIQQGLFSQNKLHVDKRLTELGAGDLEGKDLFPDWNAFYAKQYHAEMDDQVKIRVRQFYDFLRGQYPAGNIVVITHFAPAQELLDIATHRIIKLNPGQAVVVPLHVEQ